VKVLPPHNYEIFLASIKTGQQTQLTFNDAFDGFPVLSLDGKLLAFASSRYNPASVRTLKPYLMDVSTLNLGPKVK
jgi:Tol biopolymer transport system component